MDFLIKGPSLSRALYVAGRFDFQPFFLFHSCCPFLRSARLESQSPVVESFLHLHNCKSWVPIFMQLSSVSVDEKRKQGTFAKRDIKEFNLIKTSLNFPITFHLFECYTIWSVKFQFWTWFSKVYTCDIYAHTKCTYLKCI